jgi:tetratricopeptide (TPR) repeat protein
MKKTLVIIGILVLLASLGFAVESFLASNSLKSQINQSKMLAKKLEEDMVRLQAEKEMVTKENEKLQEDSVSYLGINTNLKEDKEKLASQLFEAQDSIEKKEASFQVLNKRLEELEKEIDTQKEEFQEKGIEKVKQLEDEVSSLENTLNQERAIFNYNLAVAYTQAGLYDEAVESYEKSLKIDSKNADAHYNLGLLYKDVKNDAVKACEHLSSYLELKPDAEDKEEVKEWIENLK